MKNHNAIPDALNLCGFETSNAFTTDGVSIGAYKRGMVGYDRLEVVNGPLSAVEGCCGFGGLLDCIRTKPELRRKFTHDSVRGSFDDDSGSDARATLDMNPPLLGRREDEGALSLLRSIGATTLKR